VAFKLAWGIGQTIAGGTKVSDAYRTFLIEATALAALGTIADVVPLKGENRVLAHFGLGGLKKSRLTGIRALIESAGLTGQDLDSYDVGFKLAPRLNACGRMGHAREAVEMLTKADEGRAIEIATYLEGQNRQRQSIEKAILDQALAQVAERGYDSEECRAIVLAAEGWHAGVIGIVASRIVNRFNRPTLMIALANGAGQGSGRSVAGFHLSKALEACRPHLQGCGGHEMAAGLTLRTENLEAFRAAFCAHAAEVIDPAILRPELKLDCEAVIGQMNLALVKDLNRLGPFGNGNPRPLVCCRGVELVTVPRRVGKEGNHLQLLVRQGGASIKCIAFSAGPLFDRLRAGTKLDLAVEPCLNEFNGHCNVELEVKEIRFA